jgi:non-ribosomal peptide synthetase-like protein
VVEADVGLTHRPSWPRYANRVFWELLRFALPLPPAGLALAWLWLVGLAEERAPLLVQAFGVVPALELGFLAALSGLGLALKWALLGQVRPGTHALWSVWCSRWDFNYTAWHQWAAGPLAALEGTLWLSAYLRALGATVGRGAVIGDPLALVVDPDMLTLEDGATVSGLFQAHTFEDRVLKIDRVRIGRGATVGAAAVLLYGADVGEGARVMGNSVVMKHERLQPHHAYVGHPTRLLLQQGDEGRSAAPALAEIA